MTLVGDVLVALGAVVMLLAGLGVARFHDVYARLHSSAKATSVGLALVLLGVFFLAPSLATLAKAIAALAFTYLTVPVAAHVLARQAHCSRQPADLDRDDLRDDRGRDARDRDRDPSGGRSGSRRDGVARGLRSADQG